MGLRLSLSRLPPLYAEVTLGKRSIVVSEPVKRGDRLPAISAALYDPRSMAMIRIRILGMLPFQSALCSFCRRCGMFSLSIRL